MLDHMTTQEITIRPAHLDDQVTLMRLAALDSADKVPPEPLLLAEVDAEPRVAVSLTDGSAIADPFHPTAEILALLRTHARAHNRNGRGLAAIHTARGAARRIRIGRRTPAWSR
jgi:hypothetical protein